ncbi:MAG: hypothetical protein AAFN80_01285 [Pseudomonadota bacterium]
MARTFRAYFWIGFPRTHFVTKGTYGPLAIGQSKNEIREILEAHEAWPISPVIIDMQILRNPDFVTLNDKFEEEPGVLIWLGSSPVPLRLEFQLGKLSRTWPDYDSKFVNPHSHIEEQNKEYRRLIQLLPLGMERNDALKVLANFNTHLDRSVGNFVVGEQKFRELGWNEWTPKLRKEYEELGISNDGWQFDGMKEVVWYSGILRVFYSRFTLHFSENRLVRIEHLRGAYELP